MSKPLVAALFVVANCPAHALDSTTRNGNLLTVGLPAFAAGLSLLNDDTAGLVQLAKSEAVTIGLVQVLKASVHETRPDGSDNKSFPSTHAAAAFSAAQYLQMKGGWEYGLPAYAAASYVGYSRVEGHKHYWRDVIAGGATGALTTYYFTDNHNGRRMGLSWSGRSATLQYQQAL